MHIACGAHVWWPEQQSALMCIFVERTVRDASLEMSAKSTGLLNVLGCVGSARRSRCLVTTMCGAPPSTACFSCCAVATRAAPA